MATAALLSLEEYLALPVREGVIGYEYDEGRVIEVSGPNLEHAEVQIAIGTLLRLFVRTADLDLIVGGSAGFWLAPNVERFPDVCVVGRKRAATMERFHGSLRGAPDVAIEIISPNDKATEVERKVDQYLAAGTIVVVVYPDLRHVRLCRPNGETRRLGPRDVLEIPECLPGMSFAIDEIIPAAPITPPSA